MADAFDWTQEDPKTIARYDTRPLFDQKKLQRYYDMKRASNLLGLQMLMARRMCEAGCGFVTVSDCGWDYHANNNSPKYMTGVYPMGNQVDHAVSAFIEDVEARGLRDKILLVCCGEMGRTPKVNAKAGRDHWGGSAPLMLYGGGLKMGQVIGSSTKDGGEPASDRVTIPNLYATLMEQLLDTGAVRAMAGIPNEVNTVISGAPPIKQLL